MQIHADPLALFEHGDPPDPVQQLGVFDSNGRVCSQGLDEPGVLLGEFIGADLVGEVKVPQQHTAGYDGGPEKRGHGRVVRRKTGRFGVLGQIIQNQDLRFVEQQAQNAPAGRPVLNRRHFVVGHARDDKLGQAAVGPRNPDGGIAGLRQFAGHVDDLLQDLVQRMFGREGKGSAIESLQNGRVVIGLLGLRQRDYASSIGNIVTRSREEDKKRGLWPPLLSRLCSNYTNQGSRTAKFQNSQEKTPNLHLLGVTKQESAPHMVYL